MAMRIARRIRITIISAESRVIISEIMRALLFLAAALAYAQDDLARGKKLYEGFCSLCHGQTGTGGKGPNLAQPILPRAADDKALVEVIQQGIRGTEM